MSMLYLVLALLLSLLIVVVAVANSANVTVYYLFGHAQLSLPVLVLGSACAGALAMGFFGIFRGIRTHLRFRGAHRAQVDLQYRVEFLEKEKNRLEAELGRRQMDAEAASIKEHIAEEELAEDVP